MKILYATTLSSNCLKKEGSGLYWLTPFILGEYPEVDIFVACEDFQYPHNFKVFDMLKTILDSIPNKYTMHYWTLNTGTIVGGSGDPERLKHICTGRNLIQMYAVDNGYDYIVFVDSDAKPVNNFWERLITHNYPIVGGILSEYTWIITDNIQPLTGIQNSQYYARFKHFKEQHSTLIPVSFNTAGFNVVHYDIFSRVQWRYDTKNCMTDDPCYGFDAAQLGYPWLVDISIMAYHPIIHLENRINSIT